MSNKTKRQSLPKGTQPELHVGGDPVHAEVYVAGKTKVEVLKWYRTICRTRYFFVRNIQHDPSLNDPILVQGEYFTFNPHLDSHGVGVWDTVPMNEFRRRMSDCLLCEKDGTNSEKHGFDRLSGKMEVVTEYLRKYEKSCYFTLSQVSAYWENGMAHLVNRHGGMPYLLLSVSNGLLFAFPVMDYDRSTHWLPTYRWDVYWKRYGHGTLWGVEGLLGDLSVVKFMRQFIGDTERVVDNMQNLVEHERKNHGATPVQVNVMP